MRAVSAEYESLGLRIFEAFELRKVVVASDIDVFRDCRSGESFPEDFLKGQNERRLTHWQRRHRLPRVRLQFCRQFHSAGGAPESRRAAFTRNGSKSLM